MTVGLLFSVVFTKQTEDVYLSELKRRTALINETVSDYFATNTNEQAGDQKGKAGGMMGYGAFLRFINQIAGDTAWVVDQKMTPLITNHHSENEIPMPDNASEIVNKVYAGKKEVIIKKRSIFQLSSIIIAAPIMVNNELKGVLFVESTIDAITTNQVNGYFILLVSMLVALIFGILIAIKMAKKFVDPIKQMENYTTLLIEETYPPVLTIQTEDELSEVGKKLSILSQRLEIARIDRENKEKSQTEFLSQISHELRTPVMVIQSSLSALAEGVVDSPEEINDYYQQLLSEATHLDRLVNDLLELSRLQSVEFSLDIEEINPMNVLEDAIRSFRWKVKDKNQTIQLTNTLSFPMKMMGDYGRLVQLFKNLIDNAHKYGDKDSEISIVVSCVSQMFQVQVINTGVPLSNELKKNIFDAFKREQGELKSRESTGLGLAIVKQIVERHKGNITIDNEEENIVVQVTLPYIVPSKDREKREETN